MTKRKNAFWSLRGDGSGEGNGLILRDKESDTIQISFRAKGSPINDHIKGLSTRDARLLAKRINQFLDGGG